MHGKHGTAKRAKSAKGSRRLPSVLLTRKLLFFEQGFQRKDATAQSTPTKTHDVMLGSRRPVGALKKYC